MIKFRKNVSKSDLWVVPDIPDVPFHALDDAYFPVSCMYTNILKPVSIDERETNLYFR